MRPAPRAVAAAAVAGAAVILAASCADPAPRAPPAAPAAAAERETKTKEVPYYARSAPLTTAIERLDPVRNTAYALFDVRVDERWADAREEEAVAASAAAGAEARTGADVVFIEQGAASETRRTAGEERVGGAVAHLALAERGRDERTFAARSEERSVEIGREERTAAAGSEERTAAAGSEERTAAAKGEERTAAAKGEERTAEAGREQRTAAARGEEREAAPRREEREVGTGAREAVVEQKGEERREVPRAAPARLAQPRFVRRFDTREQYQEFLRLNATHLRARSEWTARLITRDSIFSEIFQLSQERFVSRLREERTEWQEAIRLVKRAISADGAPLDEVEPCVPFFYEIELENRTRRRFERVVVYDEFPQRLQLEGATPPKAQAIDRAGKAGSRTAAVALAILSVSAYEAGHIAFSLPHGLEPGNRVLLRFEATAYDDRGVPKRDGAPLYSRPGEPSGVTLRRPPEPTGHAGGAGPAGRPVEKIEHGDLLLAGNRDESGRYTRVGVRRIGAGRLEGWIETGDLESEFLDMGAEEKERRLFLERFLEATVYAAAAAPAPGEAAR